MPKTLKIISRIFLALIILTLSFHARPWAAKNGGPGFAQMDNFKNCVSAYRFSHKTDEPAVEKKFIGPGFSLFRGSAALGSNRAFFFEMPPLQPSRSEILRI